MDFPVPKEILRQEVFKKYSQVIDRVVFEMPDGRQVDFYLRRSGHPVCVLALTLENKVVLARQYRWGPAKVLWELPGGGRNQDEDSEQAAARELLEETGYAGELEFVTRCWDCAYSDTHRYCFVARNCRKIQEPCFDKNEYCEVVEVELGEFREILRRGETTDAEVGYLGLDYLGLL